MDGRSIELLEFDKVRGILARFAASPLGRQASLAVAPSTDHAWIVAEQTLNTEMADALQARREPPVAGAPDVRQFVQRARIEATLETSELYAVASFLKIVGEIDAWLGRIRDLYPALAAFRTSIGDFREIVDAVESCIDARGSVLDTASRRLSSIRREIEGVEERIKNTLRSMLRSNEIRRLLRFPNFTMVGPHYVLPVMRDHRGEINGAVHRTSASTETVYIEPQAIANSAAELSHLRSKEHSEVRRIMRWLSAQIGRAAEPIERSIDVVTHLDLVVARARFAIEFRMHAPIVALDGAYELIQARHPLLEDYTRSAGIHARTHATVDDRPDVTDPPGVRGPSGVVPIDLRLGDGQPILVVTGPNTGGKTVALKTVGLLALMSQSGMRIPADEGSRVPIFDGIFVDIGDEQSIEQSLSTFSSHMKRVATIVAEATPRSLVLLDELGAGTDPAEGAALGRAILDELDSIGSLAIVTTHIGDLKTYAFTNNRARNAAVEFDSESLEPLYRLKIGEIGASNAIRIARRLRLPEHLLARAERYLDEGRVQSSEPRWDELERMRREAELAKNDAIAAKQAADRTKSALDDRLTELAREKTRSTELDDARARLKPGDHVVVPRFGYDRPGTIVHVDARRQIARVAIGQMSWDVPISELVPKSLEPRAEASKGPR
jgi:DNA mismatch repair protein MutS2